MEPHRNIMQRVPDVHQSKLLSLLFQNIRMRSKDVTTMAEEVLPSIEGVRSVLESFSPLSASTR